MDNTFQQNVLEKLDNHVQGISRHAQGMHSKWVEGDCNFETARRKQGKHFKV